MSSIDVQSNVASQAEKRDLSLNINAKPFTPGAPPATSTANGNDQHKHHNNNNHYNKHNNNNNRNNYNSQAPFLPPPPMVNPFMMGNPYYMYNMQSPAMMGHTNHHAMMINPTVSVGPRVPPAANMMVGSMYNNKNNNNNNNNNMPTPMNSGSFGLPPNPMYGTNNSFHTGPPMTSNLSFGNKNNNNNNSKHGTPAHGFAPTPAHPNNSSFAGSAVSAASPSNPKKPVTFPRKIALLVLGGRGSGKTTQCEKLAKQYNLLHIAGSQFVAEKKLPLAELPRVLREHFVEGVEVGKACCVKQNNNNIETNHSSPNQNSPPADGSGSSHVNNNTTIDNGAASNAPNTPNNAVVMNGGAPSNTATDTETIKDPLTATTSPTSDHKEYNGIVLDRMVGLHEYDSYYLDGILRSFGFAVELVFLLMLDSEVAVQRAISRGDGKPVDHTRQMAEHRVQYAAVNTVYSPLKILHCVECDNMPVEAITRALDRVIDTHYTTATGSATATMPPALQVPHHPYTQGMCKLVTCFEKFHALRQDMLVAVHGIAKPPIVCPASLMSGIADRRMFANPKQARPLVNSFATLKADGQRVLLFKKIGTNAGVYGINGIFHFIYDFTPYFTQYGIDVSPALAAASASFVAPEQHGIEWVLDAECFSVEGRTQLAVFDFLYLFGNRGNTLLFEKRLAILIEIFSKVSINENATGVKALYGPAPFFLKQYVPAVALSTLLPDPSHPPFPIDGVVFQHFGGYKFGRDNAIFKWKPREKCTVDFRLDKAVDPQVPGGDWSFVPMVGEDKEEVPWPNAQIRATDADARRCDLCDGTVVECIKREMGTATMNSGGTAPTVPAITIWDFVRIRPEKPTPNRMEIAKSVDGMQHMTFDELALSLRSLGGK